MTKDELPNDEGMSKPKCPKTPSASQLVGGRIRHSSFVISYAVPTMIAKRKAPEHFED